MAKSKFTNIVDKLVDSDFSERSVNLTEDEINFLQQNPALLGKLSDSSFIKKKYIFRLFFISLSMAFVAKFLEYSEWLLAYKVLNNLFTEVLFAVSMELLGATIIAYVLEITLEGRVQKNQRIVEQVAKRIAHNNK